MQFRVPYREVKPIVSNAGKEVTNPMQALGSSITYLRRYLWMAVLDITEPDDIDANLGSDDQAEEEEIPAPNPETAKKEKKKKSAAPATPKEREEAKKEMTGTDGQADELQIKALKEACKTLMDKDSDQEEFVQQIAMKTNGFTNVTRAACEQLIQNLGEMIAAYLQRALGYSILGTSKEECMFILHGKTTRNGKSTMLDAIQHLLGDYSTVAPVELICRGDRQKNAEAANPVLAKLKGKRMVTMSESDTAGKLDEATIKQYTGGEDITARELYQSAITFKPQFTMWLSCNDLPSVKDKSLFASDRVRVIEFNRHFTDEEQDKGLKDYFETPEAMRGIFTWLVAGYFKYIRFGLKMSQGMQKVIKQYEKDNDLVLQFLEEKCERNAEGKTRAKSLYDNYKMWCKGNGYYVCSMKKFNAELTAHPEWYADKAVTQGVLFYYGVALRQN